MSDTRRRALRSLGGLLLGAVVLAGVTSALWAFRDSLDEAHMALAYLLVVLGASAREGRLVGILLSILGFLVFNFFLLPPLYTLSIERPVDWWILVAFLATAAIAAELLHREQVAKALAEQRSLEIERLAVQARQVSALREADRMKDALLASVSHDLRTPLTTIQATAAEMRGEGHASAAIIEEEAERLGRFVADLLEYSRLRGGALHTEPDVNAAEDLVGAALQRVGGLPGGQEIVVRLPPGSEVPVGRFTFMPALQALVNLLENALSHGASHQPVEVHVERSRSMLLIHVMDRGPGIPDEEREAVFDAFHRGRGAQPGPGTGLGLAIARESARADGGDVTHRAREGGGTVFTLCLPAADLPGLSPERS